MCSSDLEHLPLAELECGELIHAAGNGLFDWSRVSEIKDVVSGKVAVDTGAINLFTSIGTGAEDVAVAAFALRRARERGGGLDLVLRRERTEGTCELRQDERIRFVRRDRAASGAGLGRSRSHGKRLEAFQGGDAHRGGGIRRRHLRRGRQERPIGTRRGQP